MDSEKIQPNTGGFFLIANQFLSPPVEFARLKDREKRFGLSHYRKMVFLCRSKTSNQKAILIKFHKNFSPLFENYLNVYQKLPKEAVGELYCQNKEELTLLCEYVGEPIKRPSIKMIKTIRQFLFGLDKFRIRLLLTPPRMERFLNQASSTASLLSNPSLITKCQKLLDNFLAQKIKGYCGSGITDSSFSNFVMDGHGEIRLVDLDNFSGNISPYFSFGFLLGDLFCINSDWRNHLSTPKKLIEFLRVTSGDGFYYNNRAPLILILGFIDRLITPFLDVAQKTKSYSRAFLDGNEASINQFADYFLANSV